MPQLCVSNKIHQMTPLVDLVKANTYLLIHIWPQKILKNCLCAVIWYGGGGHFGCTVVYILYILSNYSFVLKTVATVAVHSHGAIILVTQIDEGNDNCEQIN